MIGLGYEGMRDEPTAVSGERGFHRDQRHLGVAISGSAFANDMEGRS
jgi:hypothetical protein